MSAEIFRKSVEAGMALLPVSQSFDLKAQVQACVECAVGEALNLALPKPKAAKKKAAKPAS